MVVQHNLTAMNSNRMLGLTTASQAKSTEKLSSGYKINRAADDAAGLSISEKMRKQIRGLTQASSNAEDGISTVQTAEGALNEVQDMLQRMNELAVKAANGTNSEDDRSYIQNEIDQLTTEIDRVSETTKFNETYLLKGDKSLDKQYSFSYGKYTAQTISADFAEGKDGLTLTAKTKPAATSEKIQDEQNELLISLRDQGVTLNAQVNDAGDAVSYTLSLHGDAAEKFKVTSNGADFTISDAEGNDLLTVTADGITAAAGNKGQSYSSAIIATDITAAQSTAAQAKYYDKDCLLYTSPSPRD